MEKVLTSTSAAFERCDVIYADDALCDIRGAKCEGGQSEEAPGQTLSMACKPNSPKAPVSS